MSSPIIRGVLIGIGSLGILLGAFVAVENWRGDRAWEAAEAKLRSRGVVLDFAAFERASMVAPERNFFEASIVLTLLNVEKSRTAERQKLLNETRVAKLGARFDRKGRDLPQLREQLHAIGALDRPATGDPATDILQALKSADVVLDELQKAATERTAAQMPFRWLVQEPPLDFITLHHVGNTLALRATARVASGDTDRALADIGALFRMIDGLSRTPTTLLQVSIADWLRTAAALPLQEGLRRHAWSEPQLARLQALWAGFPAIARLRGAFETEPAMLVAYLDHGGALWSAENRPWWVFHGWVQQNKATYVDFVEDKLLPTLDGTGRRIFPERLDELDQAATADRNSRLPYVRSAWRSSAERIVDFGHRENSATLAAIAIALERHRATQGAYPESLALLVPRFLSDIPANVFSGSPVNYTSLPQGGFKLTVGSGRSRDPETVWTQDN